MNVEVTTDLANRHTLYAAVEASDDGRVRIINYWSEGCTLPAICRARTDLEATRFFGRILHDRRREWATVKYPRDSSESFFGEAGYEASVGCPRSLDDQSVAQVLQAFLSKVETRLRRA